LKEMTLMIIKPDSIAAGNAGNILAHLEEAGFEICAMRMLKLTGKAAAAFYAEHAGKEFFTRLIEFMTSGAVIVAALKRENAVEELRRVIGDTDPANAAPGTVRDLYAENKTRNAIHASDSPESAERELNFFFSRSELILNQF